MSTATVADRPMTVRGMRFPCPDRLKARWNPKCPEFSQLVNGSSLAMPYLEPYVIETMRKAREKITDPKLLHDIDLYIGQESTHFREHQEFNKRLAGFGYRAVPTHEAQLKEDFERYRRNRSFAFHLAYAEGFEAVALAISHMLVEEREFLFGGADPAVSSLILWHFVEEMEHKMRHLRRLQGARRALQLAHLWPALRDDARRRARARRLSPALARRRSLVQLEITPGALRRPAPHVRTRHPTLPAHLETELRPPRSRGRRMGQSLVAHAPRRPRKPRRTRHDTTGGSRARAEGSVKEARCALRCQHFAAIGA